MTPCAKEVYSSAIVTIAVGTDPSHVFHVHESALTASSLFFKAALSKRWSKDTPKEISLPDDEAWTFAIYADWLYRQEICIESANIREPTVNSFDANWASLAKLYVFSDKIQDDDCCDAIMRHMINKLEVRYDKGEVFFPTDEVVSILYDGTLPGAPARKLLVETHRIAALNEWFAEPDKHTSIEFLADLVRILLDERVVETPDGCFSAMEHRFLKKSPTETSLAKRPGGQWVWQWDL